MAKALTVTPEETFDSMVSNRGSMRAVARELGISRGAVKYRLDKAAQLGLIYDKPTSGGTYSRLESKKMPLPKPGELKRYLITSAQNNTDAHTEFFTNLTTYAEFLDASLLVGTFSYNRASFSQKSTKRNMGPTEVDRQEDWYDPLFEPYFADEPLELAPMLEWRGELNIQPTAKRPLTGLETYTQLKSGIFPHAKVQLTSVAGTKGDGAKMNYTTGAATLLNYVKKKAGLEAEFHHAFGALIVEVDSEGDWFVRQLNADGDGTFYDIPDLGQVGAIKVERGEVFVEGEPVEAINWGDLHTAVIDPECKAMAFDAGGMLDVLRPKHQLAHDVIDFVVNKGHHDRKNAHARFRKKILGQTNVSNEVDGVKDLLDYMRRDWCLTVVADANHDRHLERWLNENDHRFDDTNAIFMLECELEFRRAIEKDPNQTWLHLYEALKRKGLSDADLFLHADDQFVICPDDGGGIECSLHGDIGPNGSRGAPIGLSKMGRRANTGHTHSACILDGLYVAGTMSLLVQDWNVGPSSWSHSQIVTYPNGKRAIVTFYNGKWRGTT
jgi:hypothetical protein